MTKEKPKRKEDMEEYYCPNCGQSCSKEEYESGFCLDCDQIEMELEE